MQFSGSVGVLSWSRCRDCRRTRERGRNCWHSYARCSHPCGHRGAHGKYTYIHPTYILLLRTSNRIRQSGREEGAFHINSRSTSDAGGLDRECDDAREKSTSPVQPRQGSPVESRGSDTEIVARQAEQVDVAVAPSSPRMVQGGHGDNGESKMPQAPVDLTATDASRRPRDEMVTSDPWAIGGVLLTSLSASADALSKDDSKAVRAKAIMCSLRILQTHGSGIEPGVGCDSAVDAARSGMAAPRSYGVEATLRAVSCSAGQSLFS